MKLKTLKRPHGKPVRSRHMLATLSGPPSKHFDVIPMPQNGSRYDPTPVTANKWGYMNTRQAERRRLIPRDAAGLSGVRGAPGGSAALCGLGALLAGWLLS